MTVDQCAEPHEVAAGWFPDSLHIFTYDVRGTVLCTGWPKRCRQTGLVTHTHQLLDGFARVYPDMRLAVTQTGAQEGASDLVRTPEGHVVMVHGIQTGFPDLLRIGENKCPHQVRLGTSWSYHAHGMRRTAQVQMIWW